MTRYVVLLRGINVGGKNKVPMAELRACLEDLGFADVATYIQSGNALVTSRLGARKVEAAIEQALPECFALDSSLARVLALTHDQLRAVVDDRPRRFGDQPGTFHSDVVFLLGIDVAQALEAFDPREGVDTIWPGDGVVYSQRLSAERTRSRLNKVMASPHYQSMTIRNWNTVTRLLAMLD